MVMDSGGCGGGRGVHRLQHQQDAARHQRGSALFGRGRHPDPIQGGR